MLLHTIDLLKNHSKYSLDPLLVLLMAPPTCIYTHHIIFLRPTIVLHPHTINGALIFLVLTQLRSLKTLLSSLALVHGFKNLMMISEPPQYSQYTAAFDDDKFTQIFQLEDLSDDKLISLCPGMPTGTATLNIGYAEKDSNLIHKKEACRLQEVKMQPKFYL